MRITMINVPSACVLLLLVSVFGCASETKPAQTRTAMTESDAVSSQVLRVPQQLQDLSGLLLRYQAKRKAMPPTLMSLRDEQLLLADEYAEMPGFAYHPNGMGRLRGGRVVILVDTEVRIQGHVWCIVREPDGHANSVQLNVMPVSLDELEAAALGAVPQGRIP